MIQLSRFQMYYFSEVSADILYRYRPEYEEYKISATHTRNNITISDWFHFTDVSINEREDPMHFESENAIEPLAEMAGKLSPGAESILEQRDEVDDAREQFFTDFMCALAHGRYNINSSRAVDYDHPAGPWLLEEHRKL